LPPSTVTLLCAESPFSIIIQPFFIALIIQNHYL
jgi:hypothetical protein